jgi:hypothetical protein
MIPAYGNAGQHGEGHEPFSQHSLTKHDLMQHLTCKLMQLFDALCTTRILFDLRQE